MANGEFLDGVRAFAARELAPAAAAVDRDGDFPADRWRTLGEFGLTGLLVPQDHGGLAVSAADFLAAIEAVGGACPSTAWALLSHSCVVAGLAVHGTPEQRQRYLPRLASADLIGGAFAGSEAGGGSNAMAIRTTATADGDSFLLSGGKFFISQAGAADVYVILARTSAEMAPTAFSCFIVERGDEGVRFGAREQTMGLRGLHAGEILLQDCRLPRDRLLGRVGGGFAVLGALGLVTALGAASAALGVAESAFAAATDHVRQRAILGTPLAANPGVQTNVYGMRFDLEGVRARIDYGRHWLEAGGKGPPLPLWMAKIAAAEVAASVVQRSLRLFGSSGFSTALPLERQLRDVQAFAIHWGNSDALADRMARMILS